MGVDMEWEEQDSQEREGNEEADIVEQDPGAFGFLTQNLLHVEEEVGNLAYEYCLRNSWQMSSTEQADDEHATGQHMMEDQLLSKDRVVLDNELDQS